MITVNAYKPISKSGRLMPPIPTQKREVYMRKYLVEQAKIETKDSDFHQTLIKSVDIKNFSVSDGDMLNLMIWGDDVRISWKKIKNNQT